MAFVGSTIVDIVYDILEPGSLVYSDGYKFLKGEDYETEKIEYSTGGLILNNSINCRKMGVTYPIRVVGKIGNDENGKRVREALSRNNLSDAFLIETSDYPTSSTHVLHLSDSLGKVNRTFRYSFGAMGSFRQEEIDYSVLEDMRVVMVGYCLLMPLFDTVDDHYGAKIGRVLEQLQRMGITTCVDFVTPKRERWWKFKRFQKTLQWVDILSIGEDQAEGITGISSETDAVRSLVENYGVSIAVVHCGDKGNNYLYSKNTGLITQRIFDVPPEEYAGNTGAGDAFTAGFLHGIHSGWDEKTCLKYATAASALSLSSLTCTGGMREEAYIIDYMKTRPTVRQL